MHDVKKTAKGEVYIALYIDDNVMGKNPVVIDEAIEALKQNGLVLKVLEELQNICPEKLGFPGIKRGLVYDSPILSKV